MQHVNLAATVTHDSVFWLWKTKTDCGSVVLRARPPGGPRRDPSPAALVCVTVAVVPGVGAVVFDPTGTLLDSWSRAAPVEMPLIGSSHPPCVRDPIWKKEKQQQQQPRQSCSVVQSLANPLATATVCDDAATHFYIIKVKLYLECWGDGTFCRHKLQTVRSTLSCWWRTTPEKTQKCFWLQHTLFLYWSNERFFGYCLNQEDTVYLSVYVYKWLSGYCINWIN